MDNLQGALPANQWQLDVEYWHNIALAALQGLRVDSAAGPGNSGMLKYFWNKPHNDDEKYLCRNQVRTYSPSMLLRYLVFT